MMWRRTSAVAGAVGSLVSFVLPWAHYGGIEIPLSRFPNWGLYVVSALALQACVAWSVFAPPDSRRIPTPAVGAVGLLAIGAAIHLMFRYDDAGALFDGPVPLVFAVPGEGGFLGVVAIVVSLGAALRFAPARPASPSAGSRR